MTLAKASFEKQHSLQRSTILRVYNYYRIFLSFLFLFLFLSENFNDFVGAEDPELFQNVIIIYIISNILIGLGTLFASTQFLSTTAPSFVILIADILCLTLLMYASGGVDSGLGNFLTFTVAFGGGLILGRVSTVLPAIAFILTLYGEIYLFYLNLGDDFQGIFQAGVLGMVYFVANILFQTLAQRLRRRESEVFTLEKINQLIVDQMRTGVTVVNEQGRIRLINTAARELLSTPAAPGEPSGKLPQSLLGRLHEWKEEPRRASLSFHTRESGPELIAHFSRLSTPDPDSDTLIFLEDSTEVQRQAQQLKLASLGRLSATIAHEIRNPLGAISHAAQLLGESKDLSRGDSRLSEIIQNHCLRLNTVIENILQMSRRRVAEPKLLILSDWVAEFIEEFSAGLPSTAEFDVEISSEALTITFDPVHLSQVLGNLCQNGLRYSQKNTGRARIRIVGGVDKESGNPFIEVIDFGTGIEGEYLNNLFEPFYTTETSGTGLGLYLSKELCEANDARLDYRRAPTGGACFRVSFFNQTRD